MGISTIVVVGGFITISAGVSKVLEAKRRKDLAQLLNTLVKLALIGLAALLFFEVLYMMLGTFDFPRM